MPPASEPYNELSFKLLESKTFGQNVDENLVIAAARGDTSRLEEILRNGNIDVSRWAWLKLVGVRGACLKLVGVRGAWLADS